MVGCVRGCVRGWMIGWSDRVCERVVEYCAIQKYRQDEEALC